MKTSNERQASYKARQRELGYVQRAYWVHEDDAKMIKTTLAQITNSRADGLLLFRLDVVLSNGDIR